MTVTRARASPTAEEVQRIIALGDPIVRNLQITQCYHELSAALAERMRGAANWCVFATWASKQAGQTIRRENLTRALESHLASAPDVAHAIEAVALAVRAIGARGTVTDIRGIALRLLNAEAILVRVADAIMRGNLKVFSEIGAAFARFLVELAGDTRHEPDRITAFCQSFRDGDPPHGQRFLRHAFTHYYDALFDEDARRRAELLLLANLEVGLHEQTRLQPEIGQALEAAVPDAATITADVLRHVFPLRGAIARARMLLRRLLGGPTPLDHAVRRLVDVARDAARRFLTAHLMTLDIPRGVRLRLNEDLSVPFPDSVARLTHPPLITLLARIDPTPDSLRQSGAQDWGNLSDRMHYIADLFRCYHISVELLDPPFTEKQSTELKAGRRPAGPL